MDINSIITEITKHITTQTTLNEIILESGDSTTQMLVQQSSESLSALKTKLDLFNQHKNQIKTPIASTSKMTATKTTIKRAINCRKPKVAKRKRRSSSVGDVCAICLDDLDGNYRNNPNITLNCNHIFHRLCIKDWINKDKSCPICRKQVEMDHQMLIESS